MAQVFHSHLPLFSLVLFLGSCTVTPEPWEDAPRVPRSLTLNKAEAPSQATPDPWIQAQRLMEQGEPRPQLVGAHALKSWMTQGEVTLWNLCSERAKVSYGNIEGSTPIETLQEAKMKSQKTSGVLVLVADESQEAFQKSVWMELRAQTSLRVYLLSGGIEGWARTFPPKP